MELTRFHSHLMLSLEVSFAQLEVMTTLEDCQLPNCVGVESASGIDSCG